MDIGYSIILATFLGPITAVLITLWHQNKKEQYEAKRRLFVSLMAHRKTIPIPFEWVQGLNLIDTVYARHPKVIAAWHELYDYFHVRPLDEGQIASKRTHLLSEMAKTLGYKELQQIDIDRFYMPEAHGYQTALTYKIQQELLRVLEGSDRISLPPKKKPKRKRRSR